MNAIDNNPPLPDGFPFAIFADGKIDLAFDATKQAEALKFFEAEHPPLEFCLQVIRHVQTRFESYNLDREFSMGYAFFIYNEVRKIFWVDSVMDALNDAELMTEEEAVGNRQDMASRIFERISIEAFLRQVVGEIGADIVFFDQGVEAEVELYIEIFAKQELTQAGINEFRKNSYAAAVMLRLQDTSLPELIRLYKSNDPLQIMAEISGKS